MWSASWRGALFSIIWSFPLAGIIALVFRFPIPFAGYQSGLSAVLPAMIAVLFYGVTGGFILQGVLGLCSGLLAYRFGKPNQHQVNRTAVRFAAAAALPGLVFLAVLDWIVGPW